MSILEKEMMIKGIEAYFDANLIEATAEESMPSLMEYEKLRSQNSACLVCFNLGRLFLLKQLPNEYTDILSLNLPYSNVFEQDYTLSHSMDLLNESRTDEETSSTTSTDDKVEKFITKELESLDRNTHESYGINFYVAIHIGAVNCIYSSPRELRDYDPVNLIGILMNDYNITYEDAMHKAADICNTKFDKMEKSFTRILDERVAEAKKILAEQEGKEFSHERTRSKSFTEDSLIRVYKDLLNDFLDNKKGTIEDFVLKFDPTMRYLQFLKDWISGNINFSEFAPRYNGHETKLELNGANPNASFEDLDKRGYSVGLNTLNKKVKDSAKLQEMVTYFEKGNHINSEIQKNEHQGLPVHTHIQPAQNFNSQEQVFKSHSNDITKEILNLSWINNNFLLCGVVTLAIGGCFITAQNYS